MVIVCITGGNHKVIIRAHQSSSSISSRGQAPLPSSLNPHPLPSQSSHTPFPIPTIRCPANVSIYVWLEATQGIVAWQGGAGAWHLQFFQVMLQQSLISVQLSFLMQIRKEFSIFTISRVCEKVCKCVCLCVCVRECKCVRVLFELKPLTREYENI